MLEANKSRWAESLFAVYNRNLLRRRFASLQVSGLDVLRENDDSPTIIYANHSAWWDGLAAFQISRQIKLDSFMMMEEKQLDDLFVFRRLGAFSVVRENPRAAIESLNYAVKILAEKPKRTLWIFPQGEIVPNDLRPIHFFNGAARIVKKVGRCLTVPLAFRLEFTGEFKPEIFVKIGEPDLIETDRNFDPKKLTAIFTDRITEVLNELKSNVIHAKTKSYNKIL